MVYGHKKLTKGLLATIIIVSQLSFFTVDASAANVGVVTDIEEIIVTAKRREQRLDKVPAGIASSVGAATTGIYIDDMPIHARSAGFNTANVYPKIFDLQFVFKKEVSK